MKATLTASPKTASPPDPSLGPRRRLRSRWPKLAAAPLLLLLWLLLPLSGRAQLVANYTFAASAGTFTELASGSVAPTTVPGLRVDTGNTPAIPLGFTFQYEGVNYTSVVATSDGYLTFNPNIGTSTYFNNLAFVTNASDPLIAGLWNDLMGNVSGSQASYVVTGAPGARVFTFEWLRWGWSYNATAGSISFQIRLREGSNQVELIYRPEAATPTSPSASVGLRATGGQGPGSFLSVNGLSLSATASSTTATNNIAAKPTVSGLTFTFTPPVCPGPPPTYATLPVNQSFEASWVDACATRNAAGASWRTTPLIGDQSWRRDDDGGAALWRSPTQFLPSPVASQGSRSAIFHSAGANRGSTGSLDLYVDLSPAGTKTLSFDYVNAATVGTNNPEKLDVLLSTDGGVTFGATPLLTLFVATTYTPQSVTVPSSSATSVIRFRATAEFGNTDIGIDNVRLTAATCAPPTAPVLSGITATTASLSFAASATASSYTVTYQAAGGPVQTVSPNPTASPVALTGLAPATIYTVSAVSNCGAGSTSPPTPTITFTTTPANDLCANAQVLTPATPCAPTAGTVGGATGSGPPASVGTADDDVWYSFVATSPQHRITVDPTVANTDFVHQLFGPGSCPGASATALFTSDPPVMLTTGLVVGQTYYVRVYSYLALPLSPTQGAFTICVDRPSNTPANDECTGAVALTNPSAACVPTSGTVFGATQSTVSGAAGPGTTAAGAANDVWYSFVATNAAASISLTNTAGLDLVVNLRTGPCASGTSLRYGDQASTTPGTIDSISVRNLTVGQTYYVRVCPYYSQLATAANGTFTLCVTTPGVCDPVQAFAASNLTATSASLTWTPGAAGVLYRLEYGPTGFAPGTGTAATNNNTSAGLTGLTPGTAYQAYLTQICGSGLSSVRVGPLGFSTTAATCDPPTGLTSAGITTTGAVLGWTPGASAATYVVEYGLSGFTPGSAGGTTVAGLTSPTRALTGLAPATAYQFYVIQTCTGGQASVRVGPASFTTLGTAPNNLIVSTTQTVQGTYDNVTVTPTGVATLGGALVVNQTLTVQDGGRLNTNCQPLTGAGSFTLAAGATLGICDPAGISPSGPTGAVQVGGARAFSSDASYVYNGTTGNPATGPALPMLVRELTVNLSLASSFLDLTNASLDVARVLRFTSGSLLVGANNQVRLLSGPTGTALVDNTGGGLAGAGVGLFQAQRYVSPVRNGGFGYRHFSPPVSLATMSQLGSGGAPIVVNPVYNTTPGPQRPTVVPFPTVFGYNQNAVPATGGGLADFDQGWTSPNSLTDNMGVGQGYTVQVGGSQTITFQGLPGTGPKQVNGLAYGPNAAVAGWHLLGNPYPSPLDWSTLSVGTTPGNNLQNLGGAVYVFESSGPYAGTYRSYVAGIGNPLIASGQGFFVRVTGVTQSGTLRLDNANRVTSWNATNSLLYRGASDPRPRAFLSLRGAANTMAVAPDQTVVYFDPTTTPAFDPAADAYKLRNPGLALSLASLAGPDELSINGLPALNGSASATQSVPLRLYAPQPGRYALVADSLLNLSAATVYLFDAATGTQTNLRQQSRYEFTLSAADLRSDRLSLRFGPAAALAARPGSLTAGEVSLFPNPAHRDFAVQLPALPPTRTVEARLVNALGQVVRARTLTLAATGLSEPFDVRGLASGLYALRLRLPGTVGAVVVKRVVVE